MKVVLVVLMLVAITHAGSLPTNRNDSASYDNGSGYDPSARDHGRRPYSYSNRDYNSHNYSSEDHDIPNHNNRRYEIPPQGSPGYSNHDHVSPGYDSPAYDNRRYDRLDDVNNEYGSPNYNHRNDIPDVDILRLDSHKKESPDNEESLQEDYEETTQEDPDSVFTEGPVCAMVCRHAGEGVFEAGQQYQYEYQGQVTSRALATHGRESQMALTATLVISANTACDLKLQVVDVLIEDVSDEDSLWFAEAVQNHDLHFSYQGGRIEHVCAHEDEDAVTTNFKRGILSTLQTSLLNLDERDEVVVQERDVSGECETLYTISHEPNDDSGMIVNKTKRECRGNTHLPYLPHANHAFHTPTTDLPILRSSQSCQMQRHWSAWERVECTQDIVVGGPLEPAVTQSSQASFTLVSSLLLQAGPYDVQDAFVHGSGRRKIKSLEMDLEGAVHSEETRQTNIFDQIGDTLEKLVISTTGKLEEEEERPHMFSRLVSLLGSLRHLQDLHDVWNTYGSHQLYREIVVDALVVCERGPCVQQVSGLAHDGDPALPPSTLSTWLAGLHFHTHTDPRAISYVLEVAESREAVAAEAVMAVSSMVYRVCQQDPHHCRQHARPFLEYVRNEVGDSCGRRDSDDRHQNVKLMLRALGNAGIQPDKHFSEKCYMNRGLPREVRIAALETSRRGGCLPLKSPWKILEDAEEKIDVRIAAYLSLVPCATNYPGFFSRIQTLLEKEDVNQVGSYIWTHMCNLAEQPGISQHSRQLTKLVAQHSLQDKFNTNPLRSSRNYRYAHYSQMFNFGGSIDGDVIFTPDSYLPRRAALNLTLDLLDKSLNIFEFGGDFSGLEKYAERFFGKNGYFENEGIEKILESLRPKRDIQDEKIQEFQRLYDEARTVNELELSIDEDPRASVYLRVFGNEVLHLDNALKANPLHFLQQLIKELSTPKSFQIVDQELLSSTLLGFPLRMKVNATGIVTFSRTGKFEMSGTQRILLEGKISPSAVMATNEIILVDGYVCSSGIRRTTTRLARSDFGGKFSLENGQIVDVQFNVPGQEVATVSSSVKVSLYKNLKRGWEEQLPDSPLTPQKYCSPESFSTVLGLEVCRSHSYGTRTAYGKTYLSEPYDTKVTVAKTDAFEQYIFSYKKIDSTVTALFDTPGSSIDRRVSFQAEVKPESAEGSIIIPGKGIEAQYENSDALQKLSLQFYKSSKLEGEFEISLQNIKERNYTEYSPKLHLSLNNFVEIHVNGTLLMGPDVFKVKASTMTSLQAEPAEVEASWERRDGRHAAAAKITLGQSFTSTRASLLVSPEHLVVEATCDYGHDLATSHSLSLTLNSSLVLESGVTTSRGYLAFKSSQAEAMMDLSYQHRPGFAEANSNITILGTQMSSRLVARDLEEGDSRDLELSLSFVSPQWPQDYLGRLIYKESDNALQAEVEVNLGSLVASKMSVSYLLEDDPFHMLAGFHIQLNDYMIQAAYNIDLSKDDQALILVSSNVGAASVLLHLETRHGSTEPLTVSLEAFAGFGNLEAWVSTITSSDPNWQHFTGKTEVKWFTETVSVGHDVLWRDDDKHVKLSCRGSSVAAVVKTSPSPLLEVEVHTNTDDNHPHFKVAVGKQEDGGSEAYEAYMTLGPDTLFRLAAAFNSNGTVSGSVGLLKSEVKVSGEHSRPDPDHLQGSAQVTFTLPSGQAFTSHFNLSHSFDGVNRDLKIWHTYKGEVIECEVRTQHRDGWFTDDTHGFLFSLATPFALLSKLRFAFEKHDDPSTADFLEFEWEELKVRGDVQLSDVNNLEVKLVYENGGTCDSQLILQHKYDGEQYVTGASLALTQAHAPWQVEGVTSLGQPGNQQATHIKLDLQSPLLAEPFQLHVESDTSENRLNFQILAGMVGKLSLTLSMKEELEASTRKFLASLDLDTPWTDPLHLNVTNSYNEDSFITTLDFWSFLYPINSITAELKASYADPNDLKAHLYFSHDQIQVVMDLIHNITSNSFNDHFQLSVNRLKINFDFDTEWDENFVPVTATGQFSVDNIFDHKLELTFSHIKEHNMFSTQLIGLWDSQMFKLDYKLNRNEPLSSLNRSQPTPQEPDHITQTVNSNFHFMSPWTKSIKVDVTIQMVDSVQNTAIDVLLDEASVMRLKVQTQDPIRWYQSDVVLEATSSLFDQIDIKWKHSLESKNFVLLEISRGAMFPSSDNIFYFRGTSTLMYKQGWLKQDFEQLEISATLHHASSQVNFDSKLSIDSQFRGNFQVKWNEYIFLITSSVFEGLIFKGKVGASELVYGLEVKYEKGNSTIPDLYFKLTKHKDDILILASKFDSVYPNFDALLTVKVLAETSSTVQNGQLRLTADLTDIENYIFSGAFKLDSDFKGFEKYWAELDIGMNATNEFIGAHLHGLVHIGHWHYKTILNGSLDFHPSFIVKYLNQYDLIYKEKLIDTKDISLLLNISHKIYQGKLSVNFGLHKPHYSLFILYNDVDKLFNSYIIPGESKKFEMSIQVFNNKVSINVQITDGDGYRFQVLQGNINWNIKRKKKQFSININSDFDAVRKIIGQVILLQRKDLAANAKLRVNDENFVGSLRYVSQEPHNTGQIIVKVDNHIYIPVKTDAKINFSFTQDQYQSDLVVDLNDEKEWFRADVKASLSESHIQLQVPYKGLENIDVSMNINAEDKWGVKMALQVPKFCAKFEGMLDKSLTKSSISLNVQADCTETIFDFNFSYNLKEDSFNALRDYYAQTYGLMYNYNVSSADFPYSFLLTSSIKIEGHLYPDHSLGVEFSTDFEIEKYTLFIRAYEVNYNVTHFLYKHSFSEHSKEVFLEVNQNKLFSLEVKYDLKKTPTEVTYFHSLFGSPLNIKLSLQTNVTHGNVEFLLTTNAPFDHAELLATYDLRDKNEAYLKVRTTLGDADGRAAFHKTNSSFSITVDLISSLHSSHEYYIKLDHEHEGDNHKIKLISVQDDIEFQLKGFSHREDGRSVLTLNLLTPFKEYESLDIGIGYPDSDTQETSYEAHIHAVSLGHLYGIDINHDHEPWTRQKTEIVLLSPSDMFGNISASLMYEFGSLAVAAAQLNTSQGSLGIDGTFVVLDRNASLILNCDMTLLDFGQYFLKAIMPFDLFHDGEIRLERRHTDCNFIGHFSTGRALTRANFSLILTTEEPVLKNTSYVLGYILDTSLEINCQFETWKVNAVFELVKDKAGELSGSFVIKTNIPDYEEVDGTWGVGHTAPAYFAQININIQQMGTITFNSTVDIQPNGARKVLESMKVNIVFGSPYTLTHHLQAEYNTGVFSIDASYKYGLDIFHIKLNSKLKRKIGTFSLTGNIPVQGISTFNIDFNYKLKEAFEIDVSGAVEEASLQAGLQVGPDGAVGSATASVASPFIVPVNAALNWSFIKSPLQLEASCAWGEHTSELKVIAKDNVNSKQLEFLLTTPFIEFNKLDIRAQYILSESNELRISFDIGVNHHTFSMESTFVDNITDNKVEISALMNAFDKEGSLKMTFGTRGNVYEGKVFATVTGYEAFHFTISLDTQHIHSSAKYGQIGVFNVNMNVSRIILELSWAEHKFNLTSALAPRGDGYQLELSLTSSVTKPVTANISYSEHDGHINYIGHITVGETVYTVNAAVQLIIEQSSLEFRFESTDNPRTPIIVKAMYDLTNFLNYRMNSMTDLASASFEWGDVLTVAVKGMTNNNRVKINIEISTPFKSLPQLLIGYDGEFSYEKSAVDFTFTVFVDWSKRITLTGFFKLKNEQLDLHGALTTPFTAIERLSVSLKFNPSHIKLSLVHNNDEWSILGDYQLSPTFALTLTGKTPISGYEEIVFESSAGFKNGLYIIKANLSWQKNSSVRIHVQAEMWNLEIQVYTPWEFLKEVIFKTSLRTESEELMYSAALEWDSINASLTLIYSPVQFKLLGRYEENNLEVVLARLDYIYDGQELKSEIELQTPLKSFTSLDAALDLGLEGHQFRSKVISNGKTTVIEGILSVTGGKFTVDIPALGDFIWRMEASNIWMKMDTQVSLVYPPSIPPLTINLNYQINPNSGQGKLHIRFESLDQWLESLNFTISADHVQAFTFIEASSALFLKFKSQELLQYNVNMSSSTKNGQASLAVVYKDKFTNIPYQMSFKISLLNMFLEEGIVEFILSKGAEQIYKLSYETTFPVEGSSTRQVAWKSPDWAADIRITITGTSNRISFSYPDPSMRHTLLLTWPEDFNLEKFTVGGEINSPYIEKITFNVNFMVQQKFSFSLDSRISYGLKDIYVTGILQYTRKLHQAKCEVQVTSDWLGAHSLKTNFHWLHNITGSLKLDSGDEKHIVKLHVNLSDRTLQLTANSPWLPYQNILVTGTFDYVQNESLSIRFEGEMTGGAGGGKVAAKAELGSGASNTTLLASLTQDGEELLKISLMTKFDEENIKIVMTVDSVIPELSTIFSFEFSDRYSSRVLSITVYNKYLLKHTDLFIEISKYWRSRHTITLYYDNLQFALYSYLGTEDKNFNIELKSDCFKIRISSTLEHINYKYFSWKLKTSFEALQEVNIRIVWTDIIEDIAVYIRMKNDKEIIFKVHSSPDSVMGRSVSVSLTTPFKGYEKIVLVTPQFDPMNNNIFSVLLEYPGGKVGIIIRMELNARYPVMQFSIYLPFEKYEIMSFHMETTSMMSIFELRVGKVGITLSAAIPLNTDAVQVEFVVRLNENSIKTIIRALDQFHKIIRLSLQVEFYPKDTFGIDLFLTEFEYKPCERIYFAMRTDKEELIKAHVGWGSDKVFAITTPKRYPGFLILNLETTKELNDYGLQFGFALRKDGSWETYGFHARQEILEAGRHLSLSAEVSESQFHVEGTFSLSSLHWNESLIFELNRRKIGYKVVLEMDPGLLSSTYDGDITLLLPTRKLHYKANATHSFRELEMLSYFAWNEYETEKVPFTLRLNYVDNSLFGHTKHYLKTILSHPDIKDIIFQGNVTQARNSPLYGIAELRDGNSAERDIELVLEVHPALDNNEHSVLVSISQPASGFLLSLSARVVESVLTTAHYTLGYWSLSQETWHNLQISTDVTTNDSGYNFAAKVSAPQSQWGYSYKGSIHSRDNLVKLKLQGNSEQFEDFWKIGTDINKHLPELLLYLDVGQKSQEEYEEGRIRIGLHNPLELGAILDHKRFGKRSQDCAIGLRLLTSDILQFIVEYDPSLDYSDSSLWAQLTSPADKMVKAWQRDATFTASALKHWVSAEAPTVADVLLNKQTLQAVWESEKESFGDFMRDYQAVVSSISEGTMVIWRESLHPAVLTLHHHVGSIQEQLDGHLQDAVTSLWQHLETPLHRLEGGWEAVVAHFTTLHLHFVSWWTQTQQAAWLVTRATDVLLEAVAATQPALYTLLQDIRQAFIRYGRELHGVLDGHCWSLLQQMAEELAAEVQERASSNVDTVREFLQLEEYYSRLLPVKNNAKALLENLYSVILAGVVSVKDAVIEASVIHFPSLASEISSPTADDDDDNDDDDGDDDDDDDDVEEGAQELEPDASTQARDILQLIQVASLRNFKKYQSDNLLLNYINIAAGNVYERVVAGWHRWREEMLHNLALLELTFLALVDAGRRLQGDAHTFKEEPFIFGPKDGRIIINQRLPVSWRSFLEPPQWYTLTDLFQEESVIDEVQRLLAEGVDEAEGAWEVLGQPGALSPPFAATATIMGQHITTFDLHHYQFLGSCSYLLTRDFIGGDFTVIGVYESEGGRVRLGSVVVHTHSATVTLHLNGTVDASQAAAQTFTSGERCGVKLGDLLVTCSKVYQGCSITVSGRYFGRLAGLLGNYNYEPSDDARGPGGARAYNVANLASRWAVSSSPCYQANQAVQVKELSEAEGVDECAHLFLREEDSPFRSCFSLVNPEPYFWHCINTFTQRGVADEEEEEEEAACQAAMSYRTQCLAQGVYLPAPHYCQADVGVERAADAVVPAGGTCEVDGVSVPSGWSLTYQDETQGSADIALIVELANCNKDRNLQQFMQLLKVHLRKSKINDVRYALITVQGENVAPASAFMTDEEMSTLLGTLTLEGPKVDSGGPEAVISAATNLRYVLAWMIFQFPSSCCSKKGSVQNVFVTKMNSCS
ncbi:uncharacterized protein [Procambarus clarkii]|uniref:uncharacterized protein n=1 Tax=Procambarus clarkii TaxID=6728 RepID=UPI0037439B0B